MELRELLPGGGEVQDLIGFALLLLLLEFCPQGCWKPGEGRVGRGPSVCLLTATPRLALQPCQQHPACQIAALSPWLALQRLPFPGSPALCWEELSQEGKEHQFFGLDLFPFSFPFLFSSPVSWDSVLW